MTEENNTGTTLDAATDLGTLLKSERENRSLTIETIADRLKLSSDQIEFFEQTGIDLSALTPFQRGYLRNYAELLEVDISSFEMAFPDGRLVSSDLASVEQSDNGTSPLLSKSLLTWLTVGGMALIILGLFLINQ